MHRSKSGREGMSGFARVRHDIQSRIVSGLLVLVPLGITLFILNFLFAVTVGMIVPLTRSIPWSQIQILKPISQTIILKEPLPTYLIDIVSLTILIVILYAVGLVATNIVGRQLIVLGESILTRIPLVKTIYSASKQVVDAFSSPGKATSARSVVLIEFPSKGLRSFGFVTGTIEDEHGQACYRVFVPKTPNPTTGFTLIVRSEEVCFTNISVEEACRIILSGGIIAPDRLAGRITRPQDGPGIAPSPDVPARSFHSE